MATIPGFHCASALVAANLPFDAIVRALVEALDITEEEAEFAALYASELLAVG